MMDFIPGPSRWLGWRLLSCGLCALLLGCTPSITPQRLESEFRRDVPQDASVRQVEEFLEQREIGYSRGALERTGTLYAAIRGVKGRPFARMTSCWNSTSTLQAD